MKRKLLAAGVGLSLFAGAAGCESGSSHTPPNQTPASTCSPMSEGIFDRLYPARFAGEGELVNEDMASQAVADAAERILGRRAMGTWFSVSATAYATLATYGKEINNPKGPIHTLTQLAVDDVQKLVAQEDPAAVVNTQIGVTGQLPPTESPVSIPKPVDDLGTIVLHVGVVRDCAPGSAMALAG